MAALERILGRTLLTADLRPIPTADALRDKKYIGIYFSALWYATTRTDGMGHREKGEEEEEEEEEEEGLNATRRKRRRRD